MERNLLRHNRDEKKFGIRHLLVPVLILALAYYGYNKYLDRNLRKANDCLASDDFEGAEAYFRKVANLPLSKGKGEDGLGALNLLLGDFNAAGEHFKIVLARKPGKVGGDPTVILEKFLARGNYDHAQIYLDFLTHWKPEDQWKALALEFAAIALGNHNLDDAGRFLDQATPTLKETDRFIQLEKLYKGYRREGQIPVLLDRANNPIAHFDLTNNTYAFKNDKLFAGWTREDGQSLVSSLSSADRLNRVQTTLDLNLQKAAHYAMGGYQGTMVITDPKNGDILAAYGTEGHNPFTTTYEPGSVIKLLTYGLFLESGGDVAPYAPKKYPAFITIGGKIFYDWTTQGNLKSINEGMAVSCNLMFAQMGIDLSMGRWLKGAKQLFDGEPNAGYMGEGFFGRVLKEPEDAWELGRASIGLDHLATSSLGLCMIPMAIANNGQVMRPTMMRNYTNVLDQAYRQLGPVSHGRIFAEHVAEKLASSMATPLTASNGTARRAKVPFVTAGMKTGTSGNRPFNSVMVGMMPFDQPKITFAFYLDNGGKCEINGAAVAKRLQEQIKALAPEYLE